MIVFVLGWRKEFILYTMSGHSKWHSIKHKKGVTDAKRAKVFSRLAKMIIVAAQQGGGDPEMNSTLKMLIAKARSSNMPKDNIERAIKSGTGEGGGAKLEEVVYEAMGPHGTQMIITCTTDNTNRALTEVKTALKKTGGKFVPTGSVSFNFSHVGRMRLKSDDLDTAELEAIDAGAQDVLREDDGLIVLTEMSAFHNVQKMLSEKGFEISDAEITYIPSQTVELSDDEMGAYEKLYDVIDDLDDVQDIYDNLA